MSFSIIPPSVSPSVGQACGCVCWSPSSNQERACVAAGYSDGTLRIFRLSSSEMEMKLQPHQAAVTALQFSAAGEDRRSLTTDDFSFIVNVLLWPLHFAQSSLAPPTSVCDRFMSLNNLQKSREPTGWSGPTLMERCINARRPGRVVRRVEDARVVPCVAASDLWRS